MHTVKFLKDKKKITSYFHITKKYIYILTCILVLITSLLEP
jgi:hypothetical protein